MTQDEFNQAYLTYIRENEDFTLRRVRMPLYMEGKDLSGLDLSGLDLRNVRMSSAQLVGTNLIGSDLSGGFMSQVVADSANFRMAKLYDVQMSGAKLRGACFDDAYMAYITLDQAGVDGASFRGADLTGLNGRIGSMSPTAFVGIKGGVTREQCIANIDEIREHVVVHKDGLDMADWHSSRWQPSTRPDQACETTHCLAGWAQALCPDIQMRLRSAYDAGRLLIPLAVPMFFKTEVEVMDWLRNREYAKELASV